MTNGKKQPVEGMSVDYRLLGTEGMLVPFLKHMSSQRAVMFGSSHIAQAIELMHAEKPRVFSGWERHIGKYSFNKLKLDHNVLIRKVIPRHRVGVDNAVINPEVCIIYVDLETRRVCHHRITSYVQGKKGFGWQNEWINQHLRKEDTMLPQGEEVQFSRSPAQEEDDYWNFGVNMPVVYLSHDAVTEDSVVMSDKQADRMEYMSMVTTDLMIKPEQIPLNLHGDANNYKIFPDIGEYVGSDGILMAVRDILDENAFYDLTDTGLMYPQLHDTVIRAPAEAMITDIKVHPGARYSGRQQLMEPDVFHQVNRYHQQQVEFYKRVVEAYIELRTEGCEADDSFNALVEECVSCLALESRRGGLGNWKWGRKMPNDLYKLLRPGGRTKALTTMIDAKTSVEFLHVKITYAVKVKPRRGSKIAGRYGNKGVISAIWPEYRMPYDPVTGRRAGLICCPLGVVNRMNNGQLTEQDMGQILEMMTRNIRGMRDNVEEAWGMVMMYLREMWPRDLEYWSFADSVENSHPTPEKREGLIADICENGMYAIILPSERVDWNDVIIRLNGKMNITHNPVQWIEFDHKGEEKTVTSEASVSIGDEYILLLAKDPGQQEYAVSLGHVSNFDLPAKPGSKSKHTSLVRPTPIKEGEDEQALGVMSVGQEEMFRRRALHSCSPEGREMLGRMLVTHPHPSCIDRVPISTDRLIETSNQIRLFHHLMGAQGMRVVNTDIKEKP